MRVSLRLTSDNARINDPGSMVVTMVEGHVDQDREGDLLAAFSAAGESLPSAIVESFLLKAEDSNAWRIVSVWRSREELDSYRASVETPGAIRIFRSVGVEPFVKVFDICGRAPG
jgi:quinol monooxygenase YgiN